MYGKRTIEVSIVLAALLMAGSAATAGEGLSLRERIEKRRARIRAEARAAEQARERARELAVDPDEDDRFWRIERFAIPTKRMMGIPVATERARFYATAPRPVIGDDKGVGTTVYFYEVEDGMLRLAGLGEVAKIRRRRRDVKIEAFLRAFRYARIGTRNVRGSFGVSVNETNHQLVGNKNPENSRWYISFDLAGIDTQGWNTQQKVWFTEQKGWVGMTEHALRALGGPPSQTFEDGDRTVYLFRQLEAPSEATVEDGRVVKLRKLDAK